MFSHPLLGHGLNFFSPWSIGSRRQPIHPDGSNDLELPWNSRREENFFQADLRTYARAVWYTIRPQSWNGDTYGEGMIWNSGASAPKIWNRLHLRTDYQESNKILHGDQIVWNDFFTRPNMPPALATFWWDECSPVICWVEIYYIILSFLHPSMAAKKP